MTLTILYLLNYYEFGSMISIDFDFGNENYSISSGYSLTTITIPRRILVSILGPSYKFTRGAGVCKAVCLYNGVMTLDLSACSLGVVFLCPRA